MLNTPTPSAPRCLRARVFRYNRTSNIAYGPTQFPGHRELGINVPTLSAGTTFRMAINDYFSKSYNALYRVPRNQYNLTAWVDVDSWDVTSSSWGVRYPARA